MCIPMTPVYGCGTLRPTHRHLSNVSLNVVQRCRRTLHHSMVNGTLTTGETEGIYVSSTETLCPVLAAGLASLNFV